MDEASGPPVDVWPENMQAVNLFIDLCTQWRAGAAGIFGLDYNVLYRKMDRMGLSPERYEEIEDEIRALEDEALATMRESKK